MTEKRDDEYTFFQGLDGDEKMHIQVHPTKGLVGVEFELTEDRGTYDYVRGDKEVVRNVTALRIEAPHEYLRTLGERLIIASDRIIEEIEA